jgi:PIN domain nuclease of toxin-antitoxin system
LLDTHAFMWWDSASARLSPAALAAIIDPANEILVSIASIWEMQLKAQLGKLSLRGSLDQIVADQQANGVRVLTIELAHIYRLAGLPATHKDPFDRLLVTQALESGATLVTADAIFGNYPVSTLW